MAICHFAVKIISRSRGSSAVAAAAYRSGSALQDERRGKIQNFSHKDDVVFSEIILPKDAPDSWRDRQTLWNVVEAGERRKDAQLARELQFALPREISIEDNIRLTRAFVERNFVRLGMVADVNIHCHDGPEGERRPHAHVMLTLREVSAKGFGWKARDWNLQSNPLKWRIEWCAEANAKLAELGIDAAIDPRSLQDQGISLEAQHKIGPKGGCWSERGGAQRRALDHRRIARQNGDRIIADPKVGIDAITLGQATFTVRDLARMAHRHSDGKYQFDKVFAAMRYSPEVIRVGKDRKGEERLTSREMMSVETRMREAADRLSCKSDHEVSGAGVAGQHFAARPELPPLRGQQQAALEYAANSGDLAIIVGYAGSGKSTMLGRARDLWEAAGYDVRGAALSGIASENLEAGAGIQSRTIASLEYAWSKERDLLTNNDILVIDEAGLIGSRQMERVLNAADAAGAKVVLVGDTEQLQAIEAGAAFRYLVERYGAVEVSEIWRQRRDWQREATRALATGRTVEGLAAYANAEAVYEHGSRHRAMAALIDTWAKVRDVDPSASQLILAHTRDDVAVFNGVARQLLKRRGELEGEIEIQTTRGKLGMSPGDRIMFLRNERKLGVKNGTTGEVLEIDGKQMAVAVGSGNYRRVVRFDPKDYADLDHGYAATIHKSQGVTVDHVHMLATKGLDRHATYVAMSRHRESLTLHYGRDDFHDARALARILSRERAKDLALDYISNPAHEYGRNDTYGQGPSDSASSRARAERYAREWATVYNHRTKLEQVGGDRIQADLALSLMRRQLRSDPDLAKALRVRQQGQKIASEPERVLRMELERARERGMER